MNKKGASTDIFLYMIIAFALIIMLAIMVYIATTTTEHLQKSGVIPSKYVNDSMGDVVISFGALKWISFMLIIAMALAIFVSNFLVQSHPVFFFGYIFLVVIAVIVSVPLSNAYEELYTNEKVGETFQSFSGSSWIFLNLPTWIAIVGIIGGIFLYSQLLRGGRGGI